MRYPINRDDRIGKLAMVSARPERFSDCPRVPIMTTSSPSPDVQSTLSAEDAARADFYALISHLLLQPPSAALLKELASSPLLDPADVSAHEAPRNLEKAWEKLVTAAGVTEAAAVREEFNELFISTGTPLVNPYACRYLVGFLNEKPLAQLRTDLQKLGLARAPGVHELEDHLSGMCDVMRVMIAGAHGAQAQTLDKQREFFSTYIAPWYSRCLTDIENASAGRFYALVAAFIRAYFDIEMQAFDMQDEARTEEAGA